MASRIPKRGFFLTFEGIEGCGKTTQLQQLAHRLRSLGYQVVETREPGGSPVSEQIRSVLLNVANREMDAHCELLLYLASRAQHVADVIRPALEKGAVVLCDRFADSTLVYQGYARKLGASLVKSLNRVAVNGIAPHLTIVLDVPVAVGLARKHQVGNLDRLDLEHDQFHNTVRRGYRRLAKQEPRRVRVIDGTSPEDVVAGEISHLVEPRLYARRTALTRVEPHAV